MNYFFSKKMIAVTEKVNNVYKEPITKKYSIFARNF